jgi:hypothetical protein
LLKNRFYKNSVDPNKALMICRENTSLAARGQ